MSVTPENIAEAAARIKAALPRWTPAFELEAEALLQDPVTQAYAERELREIWRKMDPNGALPTVQRERIFANAKERARASGANGSDSGIIPSERKDVLRIFDWKTEANGNDDGRKQDAGAESASPGIAKPAAASTAAQPQAKQDPSQPLPRLQWINMSKWDNELVPERQWAIFNRVPLNQAGLLSGEGGTGKSLIELYKDVAHVARKDWYSSLPEQGPAFYIGAEDEEREIHICLAAIAKHCGVTFAELIAGGFHVLPLLGQDAVLCAVMGKSGRVEVTDLYKRLYEAAGDIKPKNISIDTLSRAFAGNEIDRVQVYGFANHMQALAMVACGAVTILAHPSVQGTNTGTGLSGSTAWHGAFRFRQYIHSFKAKDGEQPDSDLRELE